jgi:type IV pilus assembly protein PilM
MASARYAWGIDVGNRALKAVRLVRDGDDLRIDDFELIEHETVLSNSGDNRESLIQSALANFAQRHDVKGGGVAIGVSGQQSFARFIKLPPVEPKKIPEIVRFEAIQQIPFPLDDVEWSYQLFQDPESPDVEVGIFAMRKELINQHIRYFNEVDLNVQVVQMNPLAVYNAMQFDGRIRGTTLIVDLGAENTDLIIADEESVWLRSIPIGGNNFTEALVKAFKLSFAKAEDLKRNAATSKYARQIFQAMRPVFADLVAEVQRSIGFYASVHREARIRRILALGGTFRLPGLQKYLQQNLQIEVDRVDRLGTGVPEDSRTAAAFNENITSAASAYGLAIQAMGEGKITSSLLPMHIRRARMWRDKTKWFAAAAALFVVGTGIAFGRYYYDNSQFSSPRAVTAQREIESVLGTAQQLDSEWSQIEQAGAADRQRIANLKSLENHRDTWPHVLTDIHGVLPQAQPPVAAGYASGNAEQIKQVPRGERTLVLIDDIHTQYIADLQPILDLDDTDFRRQQIGAPGTTTPGAPRRPGGGMGMGMEFDMMWDDPAMGMGMGMDMEGAPTDTGQTRGFLITIRGTTPNRDGVSLVHNSLISGLSSLTRDVANQNGRRYYVARAAIQHAEQINRNPERLQQIEQAYREIVQAQASGRPMPGAGMGMRPGMGRQFMDDMMWDDPGMMDGGWGRGPGPGMGQPGQPGQPAEEDPYVDRLTGENILQDYEFTALIAVVLDPPPGSAQQPGMEGQDFGVDAQQPAMDGQPPMDGQQPGQPGMDGQQPGMEGQQPPADRQPTADDPFSGF